VAQHHVQSDRGTPRGFNSGALYRIQGAILTRLPRTTLVHPLVPSSWRKTVGLPGNASKQDVARYVGNRRIWHETWPQDACDAYCIALATRTLLERVPA
jgi:Holliday junction resolvasome RuvABC endonuclease subunit